AVSRIDRCGNPFFPRFLSCSDCLSGRAGRRRQSGRIHGLGLCFVGETILEKRVTLLSAVPQGWRAASLRAGVHCRLAERAGRARARNRISTSFGRSVRLLSTHQFRTRTKVEATYWARRSGGTCPAALLRP